MVVEECTLDVKAWYSVHQQLPDSATDLMVRIQPEQDKRASIERRPYLHQAYRRVRCDEKQ
jgi:hypothetical protein